jgi:hypothetical protein
LTPDEADENLESGGFVRHRMRVVDAGDHRESFGRCGRVGAHYGLRSAAPVIYRQHEGHGCRYRRRAC